MWRRRAQDPATRHTAKSRCHQRFVRSCLEQTGEVCGGREGEAKQALEADGGGEAAVRDAADGPFDFVETEGHAREHLGGEDGFEAEGGGALCEQDVI